MHPPEFNLFCQTTLFTFLDTEYRKGMLYGFVTMCMRCCNKGNATECPFSVLGEANEIIQSLSFSLRQETEKNLFHVRVRSTTQPYFLVPIYI